jgi:glycosyltransferase involved in cell wall biosynthesis
MSRPPFRVLHVAGSSEFGGIAPYIVSLVKMVRDQGGDASVLVTNPRVVAWFRERGIEVVEIEGIDRPVNPLRDLLGLWRLVRYLKCSHYDVVHTHTSKGGILGRLAARLANVPVVIHTTQGYAFTDYATKRLSSAVYLWAERLATHWCDFIIAANNADREKAIESGIVRPDHIATIPNCIDIEEIDATSAANGFRTDEGLTGRIVGVAARLATQKGLESFIDAVPMVRAKFPDVQFVIIGEGILRESLGQRANDLGVDVHFVGFRSDWLAVVRTFDVFVMPSLWEGLPMTLLAVMAAGRPIVATRVKGIIDVLEGTGAALLVEPSKPVEIATAVCAILSSPARAEALSAAARKRAVEHYSEATMNRRIWCHYARLLEAKGIRQSLTR